MNLAIVWSSSESTHRAALRLKSELGALVDRCCNVLELPVQEMPEFDIVLIGASSREPRHEWQDHLDAIANQDWSNVRVGFFGETGATTHSERFADAFGSLWETFAPRGANLIGKWPIEGYEFVESRALCDERTMFLGLPLDQQNLNASRIKAWAAQIRSEINLSARPVFPRPPSIEFPQPLPSGYTVS